MQISIPDDYQDLGQSFERFVKAVSDLAEDGGVEGQDSAAFHVTKLLNDLEGATEEVNEKYEEALENA